MWGTRGWWVNIDSAMDIHTWPIAYPPATAELRGGYGSTMMYNGNNSWWMEGCRCTKKYFWGDIKTHFHFPFLHAGMTQIVELFSYGRHEYVYLMHLRLMMVWRHKDLRHRPPWLFVICTGHRWIPHTKVSDAEFDVFFGLHLNKRLSKQSRGG